LSLVQSRSNLSDWIPELADADGGATFLRIADALAADIERDRLAPGTRLPTQRALADSLGLSLGTVTRAYAEAEARGLIEAVVGRGSFVAAQARSASDGPIDLGRNLSPMAPARAALGRAMAALAKRSDLLARLDYAPDGGYEADRRAAARWLMRCANFSSADPGRIVITAGAQQAIAVALAAFRGRGEAVVVEAATFNGVKLIADQLGLHLVPADMDAEGLSPQALEKAAAESGAGLAYVQPFQNPTARLMGLDRRRAILEVARRRGLILIEDDLYGPHVADLGLPPLAELAPERVAYVGGLSKCLAPGVRTGFLVPPVLRRGASEVLRAFSFGPPTFGTLIGVHWIDTGEAFDIWDKVRAELARRGAVARELLAGRTEPPAFAASPHLWLPMGELEAERVAGLALRQGVHVTPPTAPFVAGGRVSGLRLCLGAVHDIEALRRGLQIVLDAMTGAAALAENVV
jgi:DNA-binding transcriptional MocR family regulator